jgi:two-component system, NtrC family, sensor histidine kinase HydH
MAPGELLAPVACAMSLGLAGLCFWQGRKSPLLLPLGAFSLVNATWVFYGHTSLPHRLLWHILDYTFGPLGVPLALHVVLVFVGRRHQWRRFLAVAWTLGVTLSTIVVVTTLIPRTRGFIDSSAWEMINLTSLVPTIGLGLGALVLHARRAVLRDERIRSWILLVAFLALSAGGIFEWMPKPSGGPLAVLVFSVLVSIAAARHGLFGAEIPSRQQLIAAALGLISVTLFVATFSVHFTMLPVVAFSVIALGLAAAVLWARASAAQRIAQERLEQLALLGGYAARLARELTAPMIVLKDTAEVLSVGLRGGCPLGQQDELVDAILRAITNVEAVLGSHRTTGMAKAGEGPLDAS